MTALGRPTVSQGGIIAEDPLTGVPRYIPFQFNPSRLTRQLQPNVVGGTDSTGAQGQAIRFSGPATETISIEVQLSAVDGLASGDPVASTVGILPDLSALQLLIYPSMAQVLVDIGLLAAGTIEIAPQLAPLALLHWGKRIVPVNITSLSVTEEAFDDALNPVQATVQLSMRVLTYMDLTPTNPGYSLYMAYQGLLEAASRL